jgi:hypothetical protein
LSPFGSAAGQPQICTEPQRLAADASVEAIRQRQAELEDALFADSDRRTTTRPGARAPGRNGPPVAAADATLMPLSHSDCGEGGEETIPSRLQDVRHSGRAGQWIQANPGRPFSEVAHRTRAF